MSDMSYDPELLNLFLQASGSPSGANRTSGMLENLLLGYISGGINPMTLLGTAGGGGGSALMQTYASDPNPVIQQIISHIQTGTDPYRLSSFVDSLVASNSDAVAESGFQAEDLKSLALAMQKEYSGGGTGKGKKGGFDFSGAGLSSPLDVYDETNTPISGEAAKLLAKARVKGQKISELSGSAADRARKSKEALGPLFGKKFTSPELIKWLKTTPEGKRIAKEQNIDWSKVDPDTGEIYGFGTSAESGHSWYNPLGWGADVVTQSSRALEKFGKQNVAGKQAKTIEEKVGYGKPMDPKKLYEYEQAQLDERALRDQEFKAARMEEAVKRGVARAYRESGRTPLQDELKQRLTMLSMLNK